jgi:hypothetical protein
MRTRVTAEIRLLSTGNATRVLQAASRLSLTMNACPELEWCLQCTSLPTSYFGATLVDPRCASTGRMDTTTLCRVMFQRGRDRDVGSGRCQSRPGGQGESRPTASDRACDMSNPPQLRPDSPSHFALSVVHLSLTTRIPLRARCVAGRVYPSHLRCRRGHIGRV